MKRNDRLRLDKHKPSSKTPPRQMTIPVFIPHRGCGHSCTFCDQHAISGSNRNAYDEISLKRHLDDWLSTAVPGTHIEIGFFGGSFTGIPIDEQVFCLDVAKSYKQAGKVQGIRLSTRPDYLSSDVIERLKHFDVDLVELGVQSFSDDVLSRTRRGHDAAQIYRAVDALKSAEIDFGIQLMMGLPSDTKDKFIDSVKQAVALNPSCVRIYPTLVLKGTSLELEMDEGKYRPLALEEAVEMAADAYLLFIEAKIPVIRMGLQASETLGSGVVAGPHHDAFRSLVESEIYRRVIERDLVNGLPDTLLSVRVSPKHVSFFAGQNKSNLIWLSGKGIRIHNIIKDEKVLPYRIIWEK